LVGFGNIGLYILLMRLVNTVTLYCNCYRPIQTVCFLVNLDLKCRRNLKLSFALNYSDLMTLGPTVTLLVYILKKKALQFAYALSNTFTGRDYP
jgi:hypothetical protein